MNVSKKGRTYHLGKSLSDDLRSLVIDKCLKRGGDPAHNFLPVTFTSIAQEIGVAHNTVSKVWREFCQRRRINPLPKGGDHSRKLSDGDLELIELLKRVKGSTQLSEIYSVLEEVGDVESISLSSISRAIKSKLLSGKQYSRKKITHVAKQRFTDENIVYTQLFINYLAAKDPAKIKFFDEAGVKIPEIGTRLYGSAPVGERCVEVVKKVESPNATLNLLISVNGPEYMNIIDGATNTVHFWNFFWEASQAANYITGRPAIAVGDIVVMDNLAVHHFDGGEVLENFLAEMGVELLFTPTYSPDLNPIELCFNKVKTELNGSYSDNVRDNLKLAVTEAVERITDLDVRQFYRATSYLFPPI